MKNLPNYLFYSICLILLVGCTSWSKETVGYIQRGQCTDAIRVIDNAYLDFHRKLTAKALVYSDCYHDMDKSNAYLTLAARYGEKVAAETLVERGKPVPIADLATASQPSMSEIEALLIGISRGVEKGTRTPSVTNCDVSSSGKSVSCTSF